MSGLAEDGELSELINCATIKLEAEGEGPTRRVLNAWFELACKLERVQQAYMAHRENLDHISEQKQKYNVVNRNVMTRSVRRFVYDMEVALQGDPEVRSTRPPER